MSAWFSLWKRSLDVAAGAPEVIAHRSRSLHRTPWAADTLLESNRMVAEKMAAANEAWWSLWRDSLALGLPRLPWPPTGAWLPPFDGASQTRALRAADRALKPYARRVAANKARLRRKAARHG
jgi:hypothetical protein